jgi:hypothetical protein
MHYYSVFKDRPLSGRSKNLPLGSKPVNDFDGILRAKFPQTTRRRVDAGRIYAFATLRVKPPDEKILQALKITFSRLIISTKIDCVRMILMHKNYDCSLLREALQG